ncbi:hypothetical protein PoB_003443100 [Plakobranchus ocellatus]|uniref:Uncharacterized protein n=1 Tax=Plakobranchus ocellatus TaxID=259542 RepID=A0AAV4AHX5_9GAST|nr:hypothetical protein PoB_003443100 [Plakobranchus ocellatus]
MLNEQDRRQWRTDDQKMGQNLENLWLKNNRQRPDFVCCDNKQVQKLYSLRAAFTVHCCSVRTRSHQGNATAASRTGGGIQPSPGPTRLQYCVNVDSGVIFFYFHKKGIIKYV